jgi:hypothetical protein
MSLRIWVCLLCQEPIAIDTADGVPEHFSTHGLNITASRQSGSSFARLPGVNMCRSVVTFDLVGFGDVLEIWNVGTRWPVVEVTV